MNFLGFVLNLYFSEIFSDQTANKIYFKFSTIFPTVFTVFEIIKHDPSVYTSEFVGLTIKSGPPKAPGVYRSLLLSVVIKRSFLT